MEHMNVLRRTWKTLKDYKTTWLVVMMPSLFLSLLLVIPGLFFLLLLAVNIANRLGLFLPDIINRINEWVYEVLVFSGKDTVTGFIVFCMIGFYIYWLVFMVTQILWKISVTKMVYQYGQTNQKYGFWQGIKLCWEKSTFRFFLIKLLIVMVYLLVFIFPLYWIELSSLGNETETGLRATISVLLIFGIQFLVVFLIMLFQLFTISVEPLILCACILEKRGVFESIRQGIKICRAHLKDYVVLLLILFVIYQVWMFIINILLVILLVLGLLGGGGVFYVLGQFTGMFNTMVDPIAVLFPLVGACLAVFILLFVPWALIICLQTVFIAIFWTIAYSEFKEMDASAAATEQLTTEPVPEG